MLKVELLSAAERDLVEGFHFYERQLEGIGSYFLDSLFSDIDALALNAGIHPLRFNRYHQLLSKRFPFAIYYRVVGDKALVYAVLDCRRSPAWVRNRLG